MDVWHRLLHHTPEEAPPARQPHVERDPDLDVLHREQHDLMNQTGYTAHKIRDSWNEHVRRSWRPDGA